MDSLSTTTLDLLRHGECEGGRIFRGDTDSALTALGERQMFARFKSELSSATTPWDLILTSPRQRCFQFSRKLSEETDCPFQTVDDLREISFGDWDGMSIDQLQQEQPELLQQYWDQGQRLTPPKGESLPDFQRRIQKVFDKLVTDYKGQRLLLVIHGGVLRGLIAQALQMPLASLQHIEVPHACRSQLKIFHSDGRQDWPQLVYHNLQTE